MLLIQASKNASKKYKLFFYLAFILFLILNFIGKNKIVLSNAGCSNGLSGN
jgi:hypothetical protein